MYVSVFQVPIVSIHPSIHVSIHVDIYRSIYLTVELFTHWWISPRKVMYDLIGISIYQSIYHLCVHSYIYPCNCLAAWVCMNLPIHSSSCPPSCLPIGVSVCLSLNQAMYQLIHQCIKLSMHRYGYMCKFVHLYIRIYVYICLSILSCIYLSICFVYLIFCVSMYI